MKKQIITDEERLGSVAFNALVEADFVAEMKKPQSVTVYLPPAQVDMETINCPSDDIHHPNFQGRH